jgi:hypothetical protein
VAESLAPVEDPLPTALRPGPWSSPERVARAIAGALGFDAAPDRPPAWLPDGPSPDDAPGLGLAPGGPSGPIALDAPGTRRTGRLWVEVDATPR